MPNGIKYTVGAIETGCLKKGNMLIANNTADYGTSFYNGVTPPAGGYTIYLNKASGGPSIYCPANDTQLVSITNQIAGANYTTAAQCLAYFAGQSDKICVNFNYEGIVTNGLVLNLDAGFNPSYPTTGTTWYDLSGNTNNGTLTNGPTFNSANSGSIVFDGIDDYVNCGNNSSLNSITSYTVNTWLNFPDVSKNYNPFFVRHNRGTTSSDIEIYGGNGGITLVHNRDNGGTFSYFYANGIPYNNTPTLFTVTYSPTVWKTYINGNTSQTITIPSGGTLASPLASSGYVTDIGQFYSNPYFMTGRIYAQQVYNRALSATEVLQNYNAQKGRFGL